MALDHLLGPIDLCPIRLALATVAQVEAGHLDVFIVDEQPNHLGRDIGIARSAHREQDALEVGHEAVSAPLLTIESLLLLVAELHVRKGPAQQRRGHERRHYGHHQDDGIHLRREDATAQPDRGHDDLHGPAGVHPRPERQGLPMAQPAGPCPGVGAGELAGDGDSEHDQSGCQHVRLGQLGQVDPKAR